MPLVVAVLVALIVYLLTASPLWTLLVLMICLLAGGGYTYRGRW